VNRVVLAKAAQWCAELADAALRASGVPPVRLVVIVTDESGDYVGVGSNTDRADTLAIVACAGEDADHADHGGHPS
jgi:hypothetical protein